MSEYYEQFQRHFCNFPTNFQDSEASEELLPPSLLVFEFFYFQTVLPFHSMAEFKSNIPLFHQLHQRSKKHSFLLQITGQRRIALPVMWLRMISAKWSTSSLRPLMCMAASIKSVWHGLLLLPCHTGWLARAGYQVTGTVTWRYEHNSNQLESTPSDPYRGQRRGPMVYPTIQCLMLSPPYNSTFDWHDGREQPWLFQGGQGFLTSPPEGGHWDHA